MRYLSFADEDDGSAETNDCATIAINTATLTVIRPMNIFFDFINMFIMLKIVANIYIIYIYYQIKFYVLQHKIFNIL